MSKRRKFGAEFKRGAVEQANQPGISCAQVARELGVRDNLLTRWKREAQNPEAAAFGGAGQKAPLTLSDIWSIRARLQLAGGARDLALFNLAIDTKLRDCDLISLRLRDVSHGAVIANEGYRIAA